MLSGDLEQVPQVHQLDCRYDELSAGREIPLGSPASKLFHRKRLASNSLLVSRNVMHERLDRALLAARQISRIQHAHQTRLLIRVHCPRPSAVLDEITRKQNRLAPIELQTVHPQHLPEAEMMELRPHVLRPPRLFVPNQGLVEIALHELKAALEEQKPHTVRIKLKMENFEEFV